MTDLRTAAQQALEYMDAPSSKLWPAGTQHQIITALQAALAEPVQEPQPLKRGTTGRCTRKVCECEKEGMGLECIYLEPVIDGYPLWSGMPKAEPVQEPVAWRYKKEGGGWFVSDNEPQYVEQWNDIEEIQPLYTAPPQRKPLTDEEIDSIWDSEKAFADIYAIVRAIERAHGIDGAPEERHFCPRCGKRTNGIHTCTPPAPLTDEVIAELWHQNGGFHHHFARAIERWLKGNS